jgi:hypothetical protein
MEVASNNYLRDMVNSMAPITSWVWHHPDKLEIVKSELKSLPEVVVIEAGVAFNDPSEIPNDMYEHFRKLAAADVIDYVVSLRSKFESLTTPQGEVRLNVQRLIQISEQFRRESMEILQNQTVPDKFLWVM